MKAKKKTNVDGSLVCELMLRQMMAWPARVGVDETAARLIEGAYRILEAEYGDADVIERIRRASRKASDRLFDGNGGGPSHKARAA